MAAAACTHCRKKKGKRSCPALEGAICSLCCGKHRRREISCPTGCEFLPAAAGRSRVIDRVQDRLIRFALKEDGRAGREGAARFLGPGGGVEEWEEASFFAYLSYGHEDAAGRRGPGLSAVARPLKLDRRRRCRSAAPVHVDRLATSDD